MPERNSWNRNSEYCDYNIFTQQWRDYDLVIEEGWKRSFKKKNNNNHDLDDF